jgi:hypothetical protein
VGAELIFHWLESALGDRGLMLAQLAAVATGLIVLARDAEAGGAEPIGVSAALLIAAVGAISSLVIVRVQLFSLVLAPLLLALLRAQTRAPSLAIWWVVPLLALWSNLHGAALVGLGLVLAYLALERGRVQPLLAGGVAVASLLSLCLTPALARTPAYYYGLLTNLAAQRGQGMWGPLSLTSALDLILAAAALWLLWRARRTRAPLWEWCAIAALGLLTLHAVRNGVWLLFVLVAPAARGLAPERSLRALAPAGAALAALVLVLSLVRGPAPSGASSAVVADAVVLAHGSPVLADGSIDEQVALAGGRIWAGDPIDAFSRPVQSAYLDWLAGDTPGRRAVAPEVRIVLVGRGTRTQALMNRLRGFEPVGGDLGTALYERVGDALAAGTRPRLGSRPGTAS